MKDNTNKIQTIKIADIDDFENHPFRVSDDEDMQSLIDSIKENGILTPVLVRQKDNGRYEMISGHRRKYACEKLGIENITAEVTELSRNEAILYMVDSNIQRSKILPSEKAFAYKMKLDAMKAQGKRTDLTSAPNETKLNSGNILADNYGESRAKIYRFIRLTYLHPTLLELVDEKTIKLKTANELSYLDMDSQQIIVDLYNEGYDLPSYSGACALRKYADDGELDLDIIEEIITTVPEKEKYYVFSNALAEYFPEYLTHKEQEEFLLQALISYRAYIKLRRDYDR